MPSFAVLGAGSGGQTLAAALGAARPPRVVWGRAAGLGLAVFVWDLDSCLLDALRERRWIRTVGALEVEAKPQAFCDTAADAVGPADIVLVATPAHAHRVLAETLAPVLRPDQLVVLNPGRTAGALEVRRTLVQHGCATAPVVAETQSLLYTCRAREPGHVEVLAVKRGNRLACLPAARSEDVAARLADVYPGLVVADTTLATSLENIGAILHPAPVLLNTGWIETRDRFFAHYYYGISRSIAAFLESMDAERLAVAAAYGVEARSVRAWHEDVYGGQGDTLYEALRRNAGYASIDAPRSLDHRYLFEDLPTGLVPIAELGHAAGVPTPNIDLIVDLARAITGTDHREHGRSLRRLGLEGASTEEIGEAFREG